MRVILANKNRLQKREIEDLADIFGAEELAAFENGEGRLPIIKESEDITYIQNLYKKLNPIYPFGIMSILEWTFAYTGFVECVEFDGDKWNVIPAEGDTLEQLRKRLTFETEEPILLGGPEAKKEDSRRGFWSGLFGR